MLYYIDMDTKEDLIKATLLAFRRVAKMYARIEDLPIPVEEGLEVTTREAHMIQAVGEHKQMSVTQAAAHFGVTKSAASQMVAKLAKKGFLLKKQAAHSNKEFELSLTLLGEKAFQAHEQLHGKDMAGLVERMSTFSLSQVATLSVLLEAFEAVMHQRLAGRSKE